MMKFEIPPIPDENKSSEELAKELIEETRKDYGIPSEVGSDSAAERLARESREKLMRGAPEKVSVAREVIYTGKQLSGESAEGKGMGSEKVDMEAFRAAYREWLLKPVGKKPEPSDFPLKKENVG